METQIYKVRDPSGNMRQIRGPVGASDEQIIAKAKELFNADAQPEQASAPDIASEIAANPLTRFALGAASPVLGAGEWLPGAAGRWFADNNKQLQGMVESGNQDKAALPDAKDYASNILKGLVAGPIGGIAGAARSAVTDRSKLSSAGSELLGNVLSPAYLGLGNLMGPAKTFLGMAGQGLVAGAAGGALTPTGSANVQDKAIPIGVGAVTGGVAAPIVGGVARMVSNVVAPVLSNSAREKAAAKLANVAAGERAPAVANALTAATPDQTAAQAALPAGSSEFIALQDAIKGHQGTQFGDIARAQEAARMNALKGVTPDLASSEAARAAAGKAAYTAAEAAKFRADPALAQMAQDPYFQKAQADVADLLQSKGIDFKTNPTGYLHAIKLSLDDMLSGTGKTAIGNAEKGQVAALKDNLVSWLANKNPLYQQARQQFADMSGPVNQAQVLGRMQGILDSGTGIERPKSLLTALGSGQDALLKRSTGYPRYQSGDLQNVLTAPQMDTVDNVVNQLRNNLEIAQRIKEGQKGAVKALGASENANIKAPGLISYKVTFLNDILRRLEGYGGTKVEETAANMMLPGNTQKLGQLMLNQQARPQGLLGDLMRYSGGAYPYGLLNQGE